MINMIRILLYHLNRPILNLAIQPLVYLISPSISQTTRHNNNNRPIFPIKIRNRDRLNSFTDSHLITQQHPSKMIDSKLDAYFLEIIELSE